MPSLRRLAVASLLTVGVVVLGSGGARAQDGVERITTYDVDLTVERDGSLLVREEIAYDFGTNERHGILRDVPVRLRHDDRHDRVYPLDVVSVTASSGTPAQYELESSGGDRRIRVGDPDRTVTGRHRYVLVYRIDGTLNGFPDHDELYWNAIGDQWAVPIGRATVRVTLPAAVGRVACFSGPAGSNLPCGESSSAGSEALFAESGLEPFEALTVVVGFPTGVVPAPVPVLDERWSASRAFSLTPGTLGAAGTLLALVAAAVGWLVWRTGRDRRWAGSFVDAALGNESGADVRVPLLEDAETPVQFEPPDGLRPGQVGTLVDEAANPLDVTATIVDLAVRGYLRIEAVPKKGWFGKPDWTLVREREPDGALLGYERTLLDALFDHGDRHEVRLSALKNTFATELKAVQQALYEDAVRCGWFRRRPDHVRTFWTVVGVIVLAIGAGLVALAAATTRLGIVPVPIAVGGLLLVVAARWMPHRTAKGTGVLRRTAGFRRFIDESERERARFAEREHLFSEYLPYAVVFGCTDRWARAFAGLDGEIPATSWYVGHGHLGAGDFADDLDGFTVTTAGTIASTPASAGGSGFSGGSSGGGGGGGGGGSW